MSGLRPRLPGRGARPSAERVCSRRRRSPRLWVVVVVVVIMPETRLMGSSSPGACQACSPKALPPSLSRAACLPASPGRTASPAPPLQTRRAGSIRLGTGSVELTTAASGRLENKMTRQARLRLRAGRGVHACRAELVSLMRRRWVGSLETIGGPRKGFVSGHFGPLSVL